MIERMDPEEIFGTVLTLVLGLIILRALLGYDIAAFVSILPTLLLATLAFGIVLGTLRIVLE